VTGNAARRPGWMRLWPVAALLAGLALAWMFGLHRLVSLDALAEYRDALGQFVAARPFAAALLYFLAYLGVVTFSIPAGPVMTMAGGLLFGRWLGTALAVPAATGGACLLFLAVRSAIAPSLAYRAGAFLDRLRPGLERDGFWYLLSLRLLPIVPYPVGSIAPALVGMRLPAFAGATALGILPGTAIFASIGAGLGEVFARGEQPDPSALLSPPVLWPLLGLAALSLVGLWWRRRRNHG
jgi:MYXO-CTERM domain-containing protein